MVRTIFPRGLARLVATITILSCMSVLLSTAQAQTPTEEQLEMFREMSAEQQQQILESMGLNGDERSTTSDTRPGRPSGAQLRNPRERERELALARLQEAERNPRFKADDTLLLSLEIREFKGPDEQPVPPPSATATQPVPAIPSTAAVPQIRERIVRTDDETERLEELRTRILRRNPLQLDKWGILNSNELGPIPLAGLTAEEARLRLSAEPLLSDFVLKVTYLPVKPVGPQGLKPFGYQLFEEARSTFAPATDIPVPSEYVVGPGDTLEVQLIGTVKGRYFARCPARRTNQLPRARTDRGGRNALRRSEVT